MNRHKHADLIHAWAEGAEIDVRRGTEWESLMGTPNWAYNNDYRLTPARKPDVVRYVKVYSDGLVHGCAMDLQELEFQSTNFAKAGIIKLTISGETGKLAVEVVDG